MWSFQSQLKHVGHIETSNETKEQTKNKAMPTLPRTEMGIYRDNLLPIIVIDQNSFDLSITDIAFAKYFVIADELSR